LKKTLQEGKTSCVHGWVEYCINDYIAEKDLHIQCNPIKIPITFFTEIEKTPKIYVDHRIAKAIAIHSIKNTY
jgi:hypothetical protein